MHRWFPYVASLFLFIWVVNMIGFIPLPLSDEKFDFFGLELPTFGIYAATASLSVTLALAFMSFVFTHYEGIRWNGVRRYFKSWIPEAPAVALIPDRPDRDHFPVHAPDLSQRPSLRQHARRPHADPRHDRPALRSRLASGSSVIPVATPFYLFEVVIVVSIQAFIFAALSAIYIGSAIEPSTKEGACDRFARAGPQDGGKDVIDAGQAIAFGLGVGLGAVGAGIGIGYIFGNMISSVARQPELRGELQGIMWLGFALTEAVVFYGLLGGLLAFVLVMTP